MLNLTELPNLHFVAIMILSDHSDEEKCWIRYDNNVMHAKPDLRVVLKWMIYRSGSVIAAVIMRYLCHGLKHGTLLQQLVERNAGKTKIHPCCPPAIDISWIGKWRMDLASFGFTFTTHAALAHRHQPFEKGRADGSSEH